jgi:ketosteroid isomerase-like protein
VSVTSPTEVIRLIFEARAQGDDRRVAALMDPDIEVQALPGGVVLHGVAEVRDAFLRGTAGTRRVEVEAHGIESVGDGVVHVRGRVRIIDGQSLADSPAAWLMTVRRGRVAGIAPLAAEPRLRHVA